MSTITATRRRRRFGVAGIAAAAAIGAASLMPAASAAPVDITAPIAGTLNVGGIDGTIPEGTSFTGTWDDELFTFEGELDFPASSTTTQLGDQTVTIGLQISATTPVTGSWDPDAGTAEASVTLSLELIDVSLLPGVVFTDCIFAPINLDLTGEVVYEGVDDEAGDPGYPVLTLSDGFVIPPAPAAACGGLASIINGLLAPADQNNTTEMVLSFAPDQEIPTPTTTTTTVPAETTTTEVPADPPAAGGTATPATPVAATPSYTG